MQFICKNCAKKGVFPFGSWHGDCSTYPTLEQIFEIFLRTASILAYPLRFDTLEKWNQHLARFIEHTDLIASEASLYPH